MLRTSIFKEGGQNVHPQPGTEPTPPEHIGAVNNRLLGACIYGGAAWLLWPGSLWWWGLYPMAVIFGAVALLLVVSALWKIRHIRKYERDQHEFAELGNPIKQARLPETEFLTRKGVIRHVKRK